MLLSSKCQDKRTVYLKYEYDNATLSPSALSELKETNEVLRWIIFEEIPLIAYKLVLCRNRIEEYLANILTQCSIYENLILSQPGILVGSDVDSVHLVQLNELRSTCSVIFACLRQFWSNQYSGRTYDPTFLKHLSNWLILTAGVTVRACRLDDHVFILMQLLRLPSQLIKLFACLLQPPDPVVAWERTKNLVGFLNQPEVELILTLFAICLRPVRERARFVTPVNVASSDHITHSSPDKHDTPWTLVDSAGESDTEEHDGVEFDKKTRDSTNKLLDICIPLSDYNPDHESCTYLNPNDLNCLLGQLRIERVLQLLAYDYIPQYSKAEDCQINESGFMTSIAFADRLLSLIEACEKIYSGYVPPPGPQTHLGSWRSLAKRLARLIRLLLITIGFRIQNIVYQQQYHHEQKSQQFTLILSQYDSLCIRAVNCLLLSGSGLPEVYQKAGQLTCWRNLACTIPLGVTMVKTKKELFYIILKSILQNIYNDHSKTNEDSIYRIIKEYIINSSNNYGSNDLENVLPNMILNKLHHSLLSMGFNELGLSVVISVLGKFASLECRPRIVYCNNMPTLTSMNTLYRYELPEDEASLIRCIMRIIFGLSVYRRPKDMVSQNAKINVKDSSDSAVPSDSSASILSLLPISPKYGYKQLIEITNKHPQICLRLLYNLIIESALDLTSNPLLTTKLHARIAQLNLCLSEQFMRVEEILLQLAVEAPFHIMQPSNEEIKFLIDSLCHYSESCFLHNLCRLLLSRFSWDAFKNLQSDEPFIPLKLHLDTALGLCEIVDKHLSDLSHFHLSKLINPKLVSNIYKSAKSSVNVFTASLTDHFLSSLNISQQRLRIKSSGFNRLTNVASELSRRTHSVEDITVPPSASSSAVLSNSDQNLSSLNDVIDWAAELVLRLLIPGSKYDQNYITGTDSEELKEYIDQIWLKLYALHERKKCNHKRSSVVFINPITSFVMLSLQTVYTVINNNNKDNSTKPTSSTTNVCLLWQPQSSILSTLLKSIFSYKHFKLTLRTLFILFKYIPGSLYFDENNHLKTTQLLYPELKESLHDLLYWSSSSSISFESSSPLFSEVKEQQKHLQQFLSMLYQYAQNPIASSSLSSVASSSSEASIDFTLFFPYLLIGMFVELTNSTHFSHLSSVIKIFINILLDPVDCFTHLQITVLLDLLIAFEYWDRLKSILLVNNIPIEHFNANITTHGLEKYKTKLSLTNTSVYNHFQFKFKEIQEFHLQNRSTGSLHNAVITSLEAAYSWAWSQTSFVITTLKSNLVNSSTLPYQKDDPIASNRYSPHNESKPAVLHECIFNKINSNIIQAYIKHMNNFQLTPPYWLLAWIQSLVYTEETMKNDTLNSAENKTNCQYLNFWEHITPLIALYQDELISAGNQLLVNNLQSSLKTESTSLSTPVKQILQKLLLESGLIQLISINFDYKSSGEDPQKQDDLCLNQTSELSDTNIAWIFSQFSLVQGVYLVHLCPVNHPICLLLIHNVLCQIFNLISPLSIVAGDITTDQRNPTSHVYNSSSTKSRHNSSFTPGFLLLRCLPASLFIHSGHSAYLPLSSPSATSSLNKQDYQQSLFQLIIQKIRLILSNDHYHHSNKLSFTQDFNCLIDFLCQLDIILSRSSFLNVTDNNSILKFSHMLDPGYQQSMIDILLYHFNWPYLNSFMQTTQSLWNTYQYMHKLNMKIPNDDVHTKALSSVSPESSILRLQNNESYERRMELSRSSFEVLFSSSSLMTLPSSLDQFPKYMKDTLDLLRQHAKQMCDRNECFEKLQNEFCTNILPKLYVPIRVKLSQYVECQSILPSWMPGHQPCSGGSNISCEYQTYKRNEEIDELCQMNKSNIDKLIKVTLDVSRAAICDVLNCNDYPSSTSVKIGSHSTLGINLSRTVLQLQNAVSYLVHKSRLVTLESKNSNTNLTHVPSASALSTTTANSNASTTDQLNLVHSIGLQCFQQLCQNFSGPLLQCPLTKQVLSNCVGELASEFLTNLSTQHQLILDMLVALPHLSSLLSSTFLPPNPSLYMNNNQSQHPLVPVYQRLMDIRFRCNAQTALHILEKINFRAWFSVEIKNFSQEQWSQLILALFTCIQETSTQSTEITSTCPEEDHDLHKLCIVHLKTLLSNHFPDMFILSLELLLPNLSNPKCVDIWILLQDLLTADINVHSGSASLSVEQLNQLLNHVHRRLTSASSESVSLSSSLCDTQSVLIDECYSMLKNNSPQTIQLIVHFLMILACQLCEKIGCCILHNHLSIQNGQSIIMDILVQVFGCILQKCITLYYNDKRNITAMSSTISSSSESTQTSCLLSSSFILYVKCCLEGFSECLNSAIKGCPTDKNQFWANQLINLFLIWFTSTTCILSNVSDSLKIQPISTTTTSNNTTCKQDLCNTPLPLIICSSINEIKRYDDANSIDDGNNELAIQNDEFLPKWCMSLTSCVWMPNLDCLDSMIMLLLSCDHFVNHQLMRNSTSNFLIYLLANVQWWLFDQIISSSQSTNVPEQRLWFRSQSNTLQLETSMIKMDKAYVNSLTFLIVLIASCSQTNGANKDTKTQLKVIMENIQSSLDLSVVSESCYLYILSYLSEQHLPPHYVLMPPTTMEGRLFGLLAAAGGMIAKSLDIFTFAQDPSFTFKPSTGLYPNIKRISSKDSTVGYKSSSIVNISLHAKRSAYLHKITSLLGYAVLCDNNLLLNELDHLLMTDNFLESFIKIHTPSSMSPTRSDSSVFSVIWNKMSSVMHNLTNNLNISKTSTTALSSSPTSTDNSLIRTEQNSSQSLKILTWVRICNLLSELEAVAGQIGWEQSTSHEFQQIANLCNQLISLVNRSCSRVIFLSKLENSRIHINNTNKNHVYTSDYFVNGIIFWLLNDLNIHNQINVNKDLSTLESTLIPTSIHSSVNITSSIYSTISNLFDTTSIVMPHSINARLSKPFIFSLLSMNSPLDQVTVDYFVQLLNATIWSVIENAPSEILPKDRFQGICEIYSHIYFVQNKLDFLHSDLLISMCIQNSLHLPLLFIILCRINYLYRSTNSLSVINDEYNVIVADSLHWLISTDIYYMNGIEDRSFHLNGWILFLNFIIQLISTSKINFFHNEPCCSNHPAWRTQQINRHEDSKNDDICSGDFHCKRLCDILNKIKNNLAIRRKKKKINMTEGQIRQLEKLYAFIESLCCILEAWMINTHSIGLLNLEKLSCLTSSSDNSRIEDVTNMEEGNSKESTNNDTPITQDKPTNESNLTASIISSLLIRLKSFTLIEAYQYLCLQIWTDLKPCIKQILQNYSTTAHLSSLQIA
ncbi:Ectopic P granules protein 5 isoform 2 [Schistosoma japonicum]|uniref:Ectopic P granules protein 5 isoform 2 n=1 Tax=Schistosoma japonicum TaxID=6182 RepID=A0A4Z2DI03_SCHJA|nr:Ectopic P granules protein 5 isoform 2 [Schistosoma japonicum]